MAGAQGRAYKKSNVLASQSGRKENKIRANEKTDRQAMVNGLNIFLPKMGSHWRVSVKVCCDLICISNSTSTFTSRKDLEK